MSAARFWEKAWFIASLVVLTFLYGIVVGRWRWPPYSLVARAADQAKALHETWSPDPGILLFDQIRDHAGVQAPRPNATRPSQTLITSSWVEDGDWKVGLKLIDPNGIVLHEWLIDRRSLFQDRFSPRRSVLDTEIHGSTLLPNGDVLINLAYVGLVRVDACGTVLWTLKEGAHHSIVRAADGSFWVPGVHQRRRSKSTHYPDGFPGFDGASVWVDRILQVSPDGTVQRDLNVLDLLYENGLERYIPKTIGGIYPTPESVDPDVTHINDVEPLPASMANEYPLFEAGDLVVSLRNLSLVFVFDPESREVKWHASAPFIYQHDPDFVGDGWIGVFDNNYDLTERGTMLGGSRIVFLQPHTDSVRVRAPSDQSPPFYSATAGKWQALGNGHMLLTEATAGRALEVDSEDRPVWEWVHESVNDGKTPAITKATRYSLAADTIASWPCASPPSQSSKQ